jgi:hypothetical protein
MKTTSFQKTIPSLAIIGVLLSWSSTARAQEKAPPPFVEAAQAKGEAPQLVLHLSGKKPPASQDSFHLHIEDCIEVSIENKGKTTATLAEPREGSEYAWRTPIIGISILNANDVKAKHPDTLPRYSSGLLMCGTISSGDHLFTLAPGETRKLSLYGTFFMVGRKLSGPGPYRIVFYYNNDPTGKLSIPPGFNCPQVPSSDVRASTACTLRSNEIEWRWGEPPAKPAK